MPRSHRRPDKAPAAHRVQLSAVEALEALHTEIVEIEAFAHAAGEAVTGLPHTTNPDLRRTFARIYTLVSKVAGDVHACVRLGDNLIATIAAHADNRTGEQAREALVPASRRLRA
jgi:hypothetical protein